LNYAVYDPAMLFAYRKFIENKYLPEEERNFELWQKNQTIK